MYGEYCRLNNRFEGVLIGKGLEFGGSYVCIEVIGFGLVYFFEVVCKVYNIDIEG